MFSIKFSVKVKTAEVRVQVNDKVNDNVNDKVVVRGTYHRISLLRPWLRILRGL